MMLDDMKEKKELYADMKETARDRDNWRTQELRIYRRQKTNDDDDEIKHQWWYTIKLTKIHSQMAANEHFLWFVMQEWMINLDKYGLTKYIRSAIYLRLLCILSRRVDEYKVLSNPFWFAVRCFKYMLICCNLKGVKREPKDCL